MNEEKVQMPFDEKDVAAIREENGDVWISARDICANIGLALTSQKSKIMADPKLLWREVVSRDSCGRERNKLFLHFKSLGEWLSSVGYDRVKPNVRDNLLAYQNDCIKVIEKYLASK